MIKHFDEIYRADSKYTAPFVFEIKDMIRINCALYEFPRENMRAGISNMKDIQEMML